MPSLDDWFSEKTAKYSWLSQYQAPLKTVMMSHSDQLVQLMDELSSFFDSFSEEESIRDDYITRLFIDKRENIDLFLSYAIIGRTIQGNFFLSTQKQNLKNLAIVLQSSKYSLALTTGIIKLFEAAPFIGLTHDTEQRLKAENNLKQLIFYAKLWFGHDDLKQAFDEFSTNKLTQAVFNHLVAISEEQSSIENATEEAAIRITRMRIGQYLEEVRFLAEYHTPEPKKSWISTFYNLFSTTPSKQPSTDQQRRHSTTGSSFDMIPYNNTGRRSFS